MAWSSSSRRAQRPALVCSDGSVAEIRTSDGVHVPLVNRVSVAGHDDACAVPAEVRVGRGYPFHPAADPLPVHAVRLVVRNERFHHGEHGLVERDVDDALGERRSAGRVPASCFPLVRLIMEPKAA